MCAGAAVLARVDRVVFGAPDPKSGACGTAMDVISDPCLNHHPAITPCVLEGECASLLTDFFASLRAASKQGRGLPCN
jgi:tRNA(adenine34) deaminase